MKFGLYGIVGVYNFGCEAIVRGTCKFLRDMDPTCEIIYFSRNYSYDSKKLDDLDLEIVETPIKTSVFHRGVNKILRIFNVNMQLLTVDYKKIINSADFFLSVGGDIYTIPKVDRSKRKYYYYNPVIHFFSKVYKYGKKCVLYGASVGPWGKYQEAVKYYNSALEKYSLLMCREKETLGYLHGMNMSNAIFFPDPAFNVRLEEKKEEKRYIGLNFSPLSFKEVYGVYGDSTEKRLASLCDQIYEIFLIDLLFIPHVISPSENDNDQMFMERIRDKMVHKNNVIVASPDNGFLGIKSQIRNCHIIAAARMHCAINALCEGVPTAFISYSSKSVGMCEYVYGNNQWVIPLNDVEKDMIELLCRMMVQKEELSNYLNNRYKEIMQEYSQGLSNVKKFFKIENKEIMRE